MWQDNRHTIRIDSAKNININALSGYQESNLGEVGDNIVHSGSCHHDYESFQMPRHTDVRKSAFHTYFRLRFCEEIIQVRTVLFLLPFILFICQFWFFFLPGFFMWVGCWKILRFRMLYLGDRWVIVLLSKYEYFFLSCIYFYLSLFNKGYEWFHQVYYTTDIQILQVSLDSWINMTSIKSETRVTISLVNNMYVSFSPLFCLFIFIFSRRAGLFAIQISMLIGEKHQTKSSGTKEDYECTQLYDHSVFAK